MRPVPLMFALGLALCSCNTSRGDTPAPAASASTAAAAPIVETARVVSKPLDTTTHLEGELTPYENVALFARASGFVSRVPVDRGSRVKKGDLLVSVVAPELGAQRAEAQAKLDGDKLTLERLSAAAQTPGAVAQEEVDVARAKVDADKARLDSLRTAEQYLTVTAPFEGVITERNIHPGALVGPQGSGDSTPMLRLQQVSTLRLTVAVPEGLAGAIAEGATVSFTVRAFPAVTFTGTIRRISHSVDPATRSMPVELDVDNTDGRLAPGMFADVLWPVKRTTPSLFVPAWAIVQSTERTFVARIRDGVVEQVPVQRGATQGDLVEVFGALADGDTVAKRGSEELRDGTRVEVHAPAPAGSAH
ncbi:MAG TPA: efflux RND transporter periplasmic adaptor subunit [Polyangiaceae bacterium]